MDYFQMQRLTGCENPDAPDEPRRSREQVYWVRLTEAERELILDTPPARGPNSPLWPVYSGLTAKLVSARPEHSEWREAMEELADVCRAVQGKITWDDAQSQEAFMDALETVCRLRSLEDA